MDQSYTPIKPTVNDPTISIAHPQYVRLWDLDAKRPYSIVGRTKMTLRSFGSSYYRVEAPSGGIHFCLANEVEIISKEEYFRSLLHGPKQFL